MRSIRYHPLIDCETDGKEMTPLFFSTDQAVVSGHHPLYLEETIPRYYRLHSVKGILARSGKPYTIHCPLCGKAMQAISAPRDKHRLWLYHCPGCD